MEKKMIFTGFDKDSVFKDGSFTIGKEYIALDSDSSRWPDSVDKSDGTDGFFYDDNGLGCWEMLSSFKNSEPEHVRPIITTEARDILNSIHETIGAETRSESIVKFMDKNTELGAELCAVKVQLSTLEEQSKRRIESLENDADSMESSRIELLKGYSNIAKELDIEKSKRKGWMIYSAIVAAYALGVTVYCLIGG